MNFRSDFNQKSQIDLWLIMLESLYDDKVSCLDDLEGRFEFLRTLNKYSYATINYTPFDRCSF